MTNPGQSTLEYLVASGRLEAIAPDSVAASANVLLAKASKRLLTASAAREVGDLDGSFVSAYDAYRMAAECLLLAQALRATSGAGSHATVEDAVSAQFDETIPQYAKPTFERIRRMRHAAQYFDPSAPELSDDDVRWAFDTAEAAVEAVSRLFGSSPPQPFSSD